MLDSLDQMGARLKAGNSLCWRSCFVGLVLFSLLMPPAARAAQIIQCVVHVSVDGLRPDAVTTLGPLELPNFYRLRREGSFTDNARTDYNYTETLQNHCCQMTGRPVLGTDGHRWTGNVDPPAGGTLHATNGSYVAGVYDVAHNYGLRTGHFASKTKFSLFNVSWDGVNGAVDPIAPDNGKDKIDVYQYMNDTAALTEAMISSMLAQPQYVFLHLRDLDTVGHASGWNVTPTNSDYCAAVRLIDTRLGRIFQAIETNAYLNGRTAIVLTADHGGSGTGHGTASSAANYTVPFYVWGPGVMPGGDLYLMNQTRQNPGTSRPLYTAVPQPVRNGDAPNMALQLLGLPAVPGSTIGSAQNLKLTVQPPSDFRIALLGDAVYARFTMQTNVLYDVQVRDQIGGGQWTNAVSNISGVTGAQANVLVDNAGFPRRFYRLKLHF